VTTPSRRTFAHAAALLGIGLFALGATPRIPPLRSIERQMVKAVAIAVDPIDTILDGNGSLDQPWTRRKAIPPVAITPPPRVLNIDDDPDGYFSTSPLAPIDHALIFARLSDAGHRILGVGHLMAWDETEPLAMDALRKQLDRFDAAVLALPLARGAIPEPVAAPFLRWSLPESEAEGNAAALPQVNRIAIPNAEQGGDKSVAGFSLLENESDPGEGTQPLLARWGDRIIFGFPLALEIAAEGLAPADVRIHLGKEIRIGAAGPVVAIDEFGRGAVAPGVEAIEAPVKRLISEGAEPPKSRPLLTRDRRPGLAPADKAWSDQLPGRIQALRNAPRYEPATILRRPDALLEMLLVSLLAFAATWATSLRSLPWRIVAAVLTAGLASELLYLFASRQNLWLPPLALLSPALIALGLSFRKSEPAEPGPLESTAHHPAEMKASAAAGHLAAPPAAMTATATPHRSAEAGAPPERDPLAGAAPGIAPIPRTLTRVRVRDLLPPGNPPLSEPPAPADPPSVHHPSPASPANPPAPPSSRKKHRDRRRGRSPGDSAGSV
jgi:hypothetical protein